jgi:RNA polymerase sigma-70 factor (ECF subfamily)
MNTTARRKVFEEQTAPLLDGLYAAALRLTGGRAQADDLVQDTMLQAYLAWDRFEQGSNLRAWMHRIQVNGFITQYRRSRRERRAFDVEGDPGRRAMFLTTAQERAEEADGGVRYGGLTRVLRDALDALPEEFRAVVVMADLSEMTYREIADAMGCPMGTVMSRLHRGRKALARSLSPHEPALREAMGIAA